MQTRSDNETRKTQILFIIILSLAICLTSCQMQSESDKNLASDYLDFRTPGDVQAGGVRMIKLGEGYRVWTKQFGESPMKVLLLHGGPSLTHEYMECFESFFPNAGIAF